MELCTARDLGSCGHATASARRRRRCSASVSTASVTVATTYDAHLPWTRQVQGRSLGAQKERAWQRKAGLQAVTDGTQQARGGQPGDLAHAPKKPNALSRDITPLRRSPPPTRDSTRARTATKPPIGTAHMLLDACSHRPTDMTHRRHGWENGGISRPGVPSCECNDSLEQPTTDTDAL